MNGLFNTYGLSMDDIFRHQHFVIIKRQGIEKIMAKSGITVQYTVEGCDAKYAAVKAEASNLTGQSITTFGSACPDNCRSPYYLEMAEKRAKSRLCSCCMASMPMGCTLKWKGLTLTAEGQPLDFFDPEITPCPDGIRKACHDCCGMPLLIGTPLRPLKTASRAQS